MFTYLIRRLLYMIPILFGVMCITFALFHLKISPRMMAYQMRGPKATEQEINTWLNNHGYLDRQGRELPFFFNTHRDSSLFESLFFRSMKRFATLDLGSSLATDERISVILRRGMIPSLCITLPAFVLGLIASLWLALLLVLVRESLLDRWASVLCVAGMSIPIMVYVIYGQLLAAKFFPWFPAFGFSGEGFSTLRFVVLPVAIMVLSGLGADVRLYRAIFLEESRADYIRTAQAKGCSPSRVLLVHLLKNGMISIITLVVAALPFLIMGTLVLENFFGIPGLGNLMVSAIASSDFGVIQALVYVGSLLYLFGLLLTDICYAAVDPRIRLQ